MSSNRPFVCYEKGPPIENDVFGCAVSDWKHLLLSVSQFAPEGCFLVALQRMLSPSIFYNSKTSYSIIPSL